MAMSRANVKLRFLPAERNLLGTSPLHGRGGQTTSPRLGTPVLTDSQVPLIFEKANGQAFEL